MSVQRPVRRRMEVVLAVLLVSFLVFIARAFQLQIVLAEEHLARAQWGVESVVRYEAPRGSIVDRDGDMLAGAAPAVTIAYDPRLLLQEDGDKISEVIAIISRFDRFDAEELRGWQTADPDTVPRFRVLQRGVAPPVADDVIGRLQHLGVRAVFRQDGFIRTYPNGPLAGRTVGFVDAFGTAGVAGIEMAFDEYLRGRTVEVQMSRDVSRHPYLLGDIPDIEDAAGATVQLTLDRELQAVAEQALRDTLERFSASAGTVIVSRVETGAIVAMASAPDFDPNGAIEPDSDGWSNPAVANLYEPGSTAKTFTFAAALQEGVVEYDTIFDCEGGVVAVDRFRIRDEHCHGQIAAWEVIRESSNIGALRMGMRMPQARHRDFLHAFGFGQRSGITLPGEAAGVVPDLARPWPASTHATLSYGYGFSVTPLQLNMATAAIANGGVRMTPYLVERVVAPDGEILLEQQPVPVGRLMSAENAALVRDALETVVTREGTGLRAAVPGHRVAGKTGTARLLSPGGGYAEGQYLATFTGFLPADAPRFAITVMVERPDPAAGYYGGLVAAPVFATVGRRALELDGLVVGDPLPVAAVEQGSAAEVTEGVQPVDPLDLQPAAGARVVPDFAGLAARDALLRAADAGVSIGVRGTGRVVAQTPPSGTPATPDTHVVLTLEHHRR